MKFVSPLSWPTNHLLGFFSKNKILPWEKKRLCTSYFACTSVHIFCWLLTFPLHLLSSFHLFKSVRFEMSQCTIMWFPKPHEKQHPWSSADVLKSIQMQERSHIKVVLGAFWLSVCVWHSFYVCPAFKGNA